MGSNWLHKADFNVKPVNVHLKITARVRKSQTPFERNALRSPASPEFHTKPRVMTKGMSNCDVTFSRSVSVSHLMVNSYKKKNRNVLIRNAQITHKVTDDCQMGFSKMQLALPKACEDSNQSDILQRVTDW